MSLTITGEVRAVSVLLVVADKDERVDRISNWLRDRDFDVAVDTWADVSLQSCDARDVVIADSDVFRKHKVDRGVVSRFPRTTSPVIAVGFLGTQLVEAHGLAMTSGYI